MSCLFSQQEFPIYLLTKAHKIIFVLLLRAPSSGRGTEFSLPRSCLTSTSSAWRDPAFWRFGMPGEAVDCWLLPSDRRFHARSSIVVTVKAICQGKRSWSDSGRREERAFFMNSVSSPTRSAPANHAWIRYFGDTAGKARAFECVRS